MFTFLLFLTIGTFIGSLAYKPLRSPLMLGSLAFLALTVFAGSFVSVPTGSRAVVLQFGAVTGQLDEGPHLLIPVIQNTQNIEVRTQKYTAEAAAASKDLQNVSTSVAINYHLDPSRVGVLYSKLGLEYQDRVMHPAIQESTKAVVARYTAEELIKLREKVKAELDEDLRGRLLAYNVLVEPAGISLTNFQFSEDFNKAIENKQVAQQSAEQQKYVLQKAQLEADTAVAEAKGRAQATEINAKALTIQGGDKVIMMKYLDRWDGHLSMFSGNNSSILVNPSDFINKPNK
jgi:regulator of protease activity HflC (stomatin/prohibitin superfamily)